MMYYLKDTTEGMANKIVKDDTSLINMAENLIKDYNNDFKDEPEHHLKMDGSLEQAKGMLIMAFYYDIVELSDDKPSLVVDNKDNIVVFRNLEYTVFNSDVIQLNANKVDFKLDGIYYI